MRHITPARIIVVVLLIICGSLATALLRQKAHYEGIIERSRQSRLSGNAGTIYGNLMQAAESLPSDREAVLQYASLRDLSDRLERAAAYLEMAEIGMDGYYSSLFVYENLTIEVFDDGVFRHYAKQLYSIAGDLKDQDAITPDQVQSILAIHHDVSLIHETFVVAHATNQSTGEITARMQAITPTLKLDSVRRRLDLFPSVAPQQASGYGLNNLGLILSAPTTCAEVGQPVTFTMDLENYNADEGSLTIESLDLVISGNGREERWEAIGGTPVSLGYRETRRYEWIWTASEEFSNTTVLVEARVTLPASGPLPTPDPNGQAQASAEMPGLKLGIGTLTQTWEERMVSRKSVYNAPPRTLPCAQMVR